MRILFAVILLFSAHAVEAQPAAFLAQYSGMPNAASLDLKFCYIGDHVCVWRHAEAWGQVCDPSMARELGTRKSGTVSRGIPIGTHYAGWRCTLSNPSDKPPYGTSASADEWPAAPPLPKWTEDPAEIKTYLAAHKDESPVYWSNSLGESGMRVYPRECHEMNSRGVPIKTWWARRDGQCYQADASSQ